LPFLTLGKKITIGPYAGERRRPGTKPIQNTSARPSTKRRGGRKFNEKKGEGPLEQGTLAWGGHAHPNCCARDARKIATGGRKKRLFRRGTLL